MIQGTLYMFLTVVQPSSPFTDEDLIRGQFRKQIREVFRGVSWLGWSSFTELLGGLEHLVWGNDS